MARVLVKGPVNTFPKVGEQVTVEEVNGQSVLTSVNGKPALITDEEITYFPKAGSAAGAGKANVVTVLSEQKDGQPVAVVYYT
ncbi:hypothetical protein E3E12_03015 [Formicincola oecophyllae]|uniref:Uncharacterized protein n=1 Tax=Formicincola oecophyllae TaxID=2558361 RepID=A0A4Y6U7N7_9PROT|nr:hypothetical protein [Formicincola oecophyllae]QDH13342.1 hypothetical protein E3E12_03015 [Formicincola oecophyllae]